MALVKFPEAPYIHAYLQMREPMHVQMTERREKRTPHSGFPPNDQEVEMGLFHNGMAADEIADVTWRKSERSNSQGNCVEMAELTDGSVAMRNSRHPNGPALVYTRAEVEAMILGAKDGDFDYLLG
jgi:hypothetical protein